MIGLFQHHGLHPGSHGGRYHTDRLLPARALGRAGSPRAATRGGGWQRRRLPQPRLGTQRAAMIPT